MPRRRLARPSWERFVHEGGYWLWCETSPRRLRTRSLESESCWIAATFFTSVGSRGSRTGTRTYVLQVTFIVETLSFDAVQLIMSPS